MSDIGESIDRLKAFCDRVKVDTTLGFPYSTADEGAELFVADIRAACALLDHIANVVRILRNDQGDPDEPAMSDAINSEAEAYAKDAIGWPRYRPYQSHDKKTW